MDAAAPYLGALCSFAGAYLAPRPGCECYCSSDPSKELLAVINRQLERCGPEQLATAPPQSTPAQSLLPLLLAGLSGLLLGILLSLVCFIRAGRVAQVARGTSAKSQRQLPSEPATFAQDTAVQEPLSTSFDAGSTVAPLLSLRSGPLTPARRRALVHSP